MVPNKLFNDLLGIGGGPAYILKNGRFAGLPHPNKVEGKDCFLKNQHKDVLVKKLN